jgi:hypothetical protein
MKTILKILSLIVLLMLIVKLFTAVLVEPWTRKKIMAELNEKAAIYCTDIKRVHISLIKRGIELDSVSIRMKRTDGERGNLNGKIATAKLVGINAFKLIFKKDICINEILISGSSIEGKISFPIKVMTLKISPANILIGRVFLDQTDLNIRSFSTSQSFSVKNGNLIVSDILIKKHDTLNAALINKFDFKATQLRSSTPDSMYSYQACNLNYSGSSKILTADTFSIKPGYKDYDFTSRYEFQTNRFDACFTDISIKGFDASDFIRSGSLVSSYVGIGKMDMSVFRDKRKKFRHKNKPAFQDIIYDYPATLGIDSIFLTEGNITYTVHGEKANEPGYITFNKINARISKITNDSLYKTKSGYLELKANALLMGKGRTDVFLKGRIFDKDNTFSLEGTLSELEAEDLNPILEKNAFIYATSGKIDKMTFIFSATNTKATGKMTLLYNGLNIAVKNKHTDDTTALRERFISYIANKKVMDSNPMPGKKVRGGIIENNRDPERFLFHYCFRSILSGIRTTIVKSPKRK